MTRLGLSLLICDMGPIVEAGRIRGTQLPPWGRSWHITSTQHRVAISSAPAVGKATSPWTCPVSWEGKPSQREAGGPTLPHAPICRDVQVMLSVVLKDSQCPRRWVKRPLS